jgi:Dolichyl-phosphate-mannose-protein mannosyltransferase
MSASSAAGARAAPLRVPIPAVLGGTVLLATVLHAALALRSPTPWIVPDELIYSELAKSLGEGGLPRIRGEASFAWGLGYPTLLAPIWAMFDDVPTAYTVAKILNAFLMSLTAIPAYLVARRFVGDAHATLVAALSVSVPALLYAGTLMTEVALYPAFMVAVLAMTVALERPRPAAQVAVLGAIGVACTIKTLAIVLLPAWLTAVALYHWLDTRSRVRWQARMRLYRMTWIAAGVATAAVLAVILASGRSPQDVLGTYSTVVNDMDVSAVPRWILVHVAELDLSLAVVPFAASVIVLARGLGREAGRTDRLFAAIAVPVLVAWLVGVGAFASVPFLESSGYPQNVERLQGRSSFMLGPLLFVGLAIWLRDRRISRRILVPAITAAVLLPAVIPVHELSANVRFQSLPLVPWVAARDDVAWPLGVLFLTVALAAVFVFAMRLHSPTGLVVGAVLFVVGAVGLTAYVSQQRASEWTRSHAWGVSPTWVDEAADDEPVSILWAEQPGSRFVDLEPRHRVVFVGEFFNRSIGAVYELGSPMPYDLPTTRVRLADGRVVDESGRSADLGGLVLVPCHVDVVGTSVARDPSTGAQVVRVSYPLRARVARPDSCTGGARP